MSTARASALALGSALAVLALFFLPVLTGDGVFLSGDTGQLHLGLKTWIGEELRRGHLPEWNPYLGLGAPVTAGAIDALFHPFTLLLLVLPPLAALQAWVLLSYALAAVGGFLWARRLGAGPAAAALGALAFSLSGFLVSSSANLTFLTALASLPLLLAAVHAFVEAPGPGRLALTCLAAWGAASAGDPQSFGLVLVGLPAYGALVVQDGTPPLRRGLLGLAAAAAAVVAAAPALWPVAAWVPHSSRGELLDVREVFRWNLPPLRLLELGIPGLFGGEPGVMMSRTYRAFGGDPVSQHPWVASVHLGASALALAALAASRRRSARALLALAALTLWMAMGPAAGFTQLFGWLPVLGRFRYWEKLAFFPALLVAGAAAVGAQLLLAREAQPTRAARSFALAALLLLAGAGACWLAPGWVATPLSSTPERLAAAPYLMLAAREGLVMAAVSLLALAGVALLAGGDRLRRAVPALLVAVVALELFGSSSRAWIASAPAAVEPTTPLVEHLRAQPGLQRTIAPVVEVAWERFGRPGLSQEAAALRWMGRSLLPAVNVRWRIGNFRNYLALVPARANRFERRIGDDHLLPTVGLWGVGHVVVVDGPSEAARFGLQPPFLAEAEDAESGLTLVGVPHRPRAYLARELRSVDRRGAMEFALAGDPSGPASVVEAPVPETYAPPEGQVTLVVDQGERVELRVRSNRPALLVLNDALAEGWRAEVGGLPAPILPANYLARGVWVGAGESTVSFRYRTPLLAESWWASAGLAGVLVVWTGWRRRRRAGPG